MNKLLMMAIRWLGWAVLTAVLAGVSSALFLLGLDEVTHTRLAHPWLLYGLPLVGFSIGWAYHYWAGSAVKGNNLLLEEYQQPKQRIPVRMAPFILLSTLATHLVGGSAGREGTAVQLGASLSDQLGRWVRLDGDDRKLLLLMGISAGFSAVFGTPFAGAIFAVEVLPAGRFGLKAYLPVLAAALLADQVCLLFPVHHSHYSIGSLPLWTLQTVFWVAAAGLLFGFAARLFSYASHWITAFSSARIHFPPYRPLFGGVLLLLLFQLFSGSTYSGLGIPTILAAFEQPMEGQVFLIKLALTALTLGFGFKGGEVTPLFFIGATLGSALSAWIPLPTAFLAGLGFVAVFAGASNTPIACTVMGMELLGPAAGPWLGIAALLAFLFSGKKGIYTAQPVAAIKSEGISWVKKYLWNAENPK